MELPADSQDLFGYGDSDDEIWETLLTPEPIPAPKVPESEWPKP